MEKQKDKRLRPVCWFFLGPPGDAPSPVKAPPAETAPAAVSGITVPSLENLTKFAALAAGAVFGALFIGYQTFYQKLGINPEQVGVTHTFILVRSVGFIVIVGLIFSLWFAATSIIIGLLDDRGQRFRVWMSYGYNLIVGLVVGGGIYLCISRGFGPCQTVCFFLGVFVLSGLAGILAIHCSDAARVRFGLIIAAVGAFLVATAFTQCKATLLADNVNSGRPVKPWLVYSVPLLDVSTDPIRASWTCPESQKPAVFTRNQEDDQHAPPPRDPTVNGMLIGDTDKNHIIRIWKPTESRFEIVTLPQNCTLLTRGPGRPSH